MKRIIFYGGVVLLLLCGCATQPSSVRVEDADAMLHLGWELQPEHLFFPEYLFMADFELDQHGRIPESPWVGAGLKTKLSLPITFWRFFKVLTAKGWEVIVLESDEKVFRLRAVLEADTLEIRAVQGTGPTQIFILYRPKPVSLVDGKR